MKSASKTKCNSLVDTLRTQILSGNYRFGEKLPTVELLSRRFSLSGMTVKKALYRQREDGYITCGPRVGSIVCYTPATSGATARVVNLVCPDDDYSGNAQFFQVGRALFAQAGWAVHSYQYKSSLTELRMQMSTPGAYTVLFRCTLMPEDFRASAVHLVRQMVSLGEYDLDTGMTSISCDEYQTMSLCLKHFRRQKLTRTGFVLFFPESLLQQIRLTAWRSQLMDTGASFDWCSRHCFTAIVDLDPVDQLIDRILDNPGLRELDSIIIPATGFATRFMERACARGLRIPQDLAVITIGNEPECEARHPFLSSIDNNVRGHLELALRIFENRIAGQGEFQRIFTCPPKLIIRESSVPPPAEQHPCVHPSVSALAQSTSKP